MDYAEVKKEYVIETLGKGTPVIMCDFNTMRMQDCMDMTVGAINAFINKAGVKFFKAVASE